MYLLHFVFFSLAFSSESREWTEPECSLLLQEFPKGIFSTDDCYYIKKLMQKKGFSKRSCSAYYYKSRRLVRQNSKRILNAATSSAETSITHIETTLNQQPDQMAFIMHPFCMPFCAELQEHPIWTQLKETYEKRVAELDRREAERVAELQRDNERRELEHQEMMSELKERIHQLAEFQSVLKSQTNRKLETIEETPITPRKQQQRGTPASSSKDLPATPSTRFSSQASSLTNSPKMTNCTICNRRGCPGGSGCTGKKSSTGLVPFTLNGKDAA